MISILLAAAVFGQDPILTCPLMPVEPVASAGQYDWGGLRIAFCCQGCRNSFESDPNEVVEAGRRSGRVFAVSIFDPVSRTRIDREKKLAASSDHDGVRFQFAESSSRERFLMAAKTFAKIPPKESTYCFAKRTEIGNYAKAKSYEDRKDVRFYLDCDECIRRFNEDFESFSRAAQQATREIQMHAVKKGEEFKGFNR